MPVPQSPAAIDREAFTFRIERELNHPRELVFRAWSACEHVSRWWPPVDFTLPVCEMDFRPGGTWFYAMYREDFGYAYGLMEYLAIEAPELIEFRDHFVDEHRTPSPDMPSGSGRVDFLDLGGGRTLLVNTITYASLADLEKVVSMGMEQGFSSSIDKLDAHLSSLTG